MDLSHLYPKKGDDVLAWWEKVIAWAKTLGVEIGPGMFTSQGPNGTQILVRGESPVRTPFRVGLTGRRVTVSEGFLGERVPFIQTASGDWVRLDGTAADGVTPSPLGRPSIDLARAEPGEDRRGAIALRVRTDARGIPLDDREDPEALSIAYLAEFGATARRALAAEGWGIQPLAIVYWQGSAPGRVGQIVRHNLVHSFAASAAEGEPGRHFFSAV